MLVTRPSELPVARARRVAIVGAGAVGLFLAKGLSDAGVEVVLIESGGRALSSFDQGSFESVGRPHEGIKLARSRTLGGTTNLWGGQLAEIQAIDLAGRPCMHDGAWPIAYEEIARHFPSVYAQLGIDAAFHRDADIWRAIRAAPAALGGDVEMFLTRWLKVPNFAAQFGAMIDQDPRVSVLLDHTVVGFERAGADARPGAIGAVRVVGERGEESRIEGDCFVLANGTIEIARLLLHAAEDAAWACPWRGNPMLGARFLDHLGGDLAAIEPTNRKRFFDAFSTIAIGRQKFQPSMRLRPDALLRDGAYNIQGFISFDGSVSQQLVYLKQFLQAAVRDRKLRSVREVVMNAGASMRYLVPIMWRYAVDHRVFVPSDAKIKLHVHSEQGVNDASRIRIDPSVRDRFGLPRVVLDWRLRGDEQASLLNFATRAKESLGGAAAARVTIDPRLVAMDAAFMNEPTIKDSYHHSGGAIMGANDSEGVVDRDLRVFGTENLYVAGSAAFRTLGNANTTLTALALTTRLVDRLLK